MRRAYAKVREGGISEGEVDGTHVKLRQIMQSAVDNALIGKNPCLSIKLPKPTYKERRPLTAEKASQLLDRLLAERGSAKAVGTLILPECGLRRGEMLGIEWDDYDPAARTLRIARQYSSDNTLRPPKSRMSRRAVTISETLSRALDGWREEQRTQLSSYSITQIGATPIVHAIGVSGGRGGEASRRNPPRRPQLRQVVQGLLCGQRIRRVQERQEVVRAGRQGVRAG